MAGVNWRARHTAARASIAQGRSHIFDKTMDMIADLDDFPHDRWHVDPLATGDATGKNWADAFTTMTEAIAAAGNGDLILFTGRLTENIVSGTTPTNLVFRGADATVRDPTWTTGGNTAVLANVIAPGWTFQNVRFVMSTAYAGLYFNFDGTNLGYQFKVEDCSFYGLISTQPAVELYGAPFLSEVINCHFDQIGGTGGAGIGCLNTGYACPNRCTFAYNRFTECANQISMHGSNNCIYVHNILQGTGHTIATVKHLYLNPGNSNDNTVSKNIMGGDYDLDANSYAAGSGDNWIGNFAEDVTACTSGITLAVPA